ncbi:hypothetical protein [Candidatus Lokiarchaeum ossiferum]|uniref:hypothetical protein n=1 Tax=Candidatus Lokiarchaeum ossiferum TaxID=2951803 RepID=UPI00352C33A8
MEEAQLVDIVNKMSAKNSFRYHYISVDEILFRSRIEDLLQLCQKKGIILASDEIKVKQKIIYKILHFYYNQYQSDKAIQSSYLDSIHYLGEDLLKLLPVISNEFLFDFVSKTELINVFADYCADLGINVYRVLNDETYNLDAYLIKKTKGVFVTTESVIVRTGFELKVEDYEKILSSLARSTLISEWKLFVTTPIGALIIGMDKLLADMKRLHTWLYIVDPVQKRVFGVEKGKTSKNEDSNLRDEYITNLPSTPLRTASQVVKISKYAFEEKYAYKHKIYRKFFFSDQAVSKMMEHSKLIKPMFIDIFRSLIILDKKSGLTIYSYKQKDVDEQMVGGFLSAFDSFVSSVSGSTKLEEINYQGFTINAILGKKIKVISILSKSGGQIFKERLSVFTKLFEQKLNEELDLFYETGQSIASIDHLIVPLIKSTLSI